VETASSFIVNCLLLIVGKRPFPIPRSLLDISKKQTNLSKIPAGHASQTRHPLDFLPAIGYHMHITRLSG